MVVNLADTIYFIYTTEQKFLVNETKNQKYRINGALRSTRLPNNAKLCQAFSDHLIYSAKQLPRKADLRPYMTPVEDQSQIGSCVANSLAGAYEYITKKKHGTNIDVSRLFIYYNARVKDNGGDQHVTDSGTTLTSAIETLEELGTCLESLWPYDISKCNTRPSDEAYKQAKLHPITDALQIKINLNEMKSCLAQGFPFGFGLTLFSSFGRAASSGVVPMPTRSERSQTPLGGHALLAVGYSDLSQSFIVRNSWGTNWGDKGYCYIPYSYITNTDLCFDAWAIRKVATNDFGKDHWDNDDSLDYRKIDNPDGDNDEYRMITDGE